MSNTTSCLNCGSVFDLTYNFCPQCGQKANDELTIKVLFNQTISNFFSLDARFFKSYLPLMFKPGLVARRYVDGKRLQYLHPAQFYLFVSVVFFFLLSLVTRRQQQEFDTALKKGFAKETTIVGVGQEDVQISKERWTPNKKTILDSMAIDTSTISIFGFQAKKSSLDSLIAKGVTKEEKLALFGITEKSGGFTRLVGSQFLKIYEQRGGGILKSVYDTIPITMFFVLPVFALILQLLYFKGATFAHHLVFSFYYFTFLFMVLSFLAFLNLITEVPDWIDLLVFSSTFIYLILALRKFYQQRLFRTILKTVLLALIYFTIVIPFSFVLVVFISLLTY